MLIVQKYGGSSLADNEKILAAARRAAALARQGANVVMVVSAQADTTDILIQKAQGLCPRACAREMDAFLAAGEQMSAALMAMALEALGQKAISLAGWQAGIRTDDLHGNARILDIQTARIRQELEKGQVVVVAGFQGISPHGDITTLGRGGSDTTAVALAACLQAGLCQIYTDVDGIYDRDPRKFTDAVKFDRIDYDPMLALIREGAQVLHDRSVELAKEHRLVVEVLSAFSDAPGTLVGPA